MENQQGPAGQHRGLCSILCNNLMVPRERDGGGIVRESGMDMDNTAVFNMENQQEPAGKHRGFCSVSCGSLDGRGVWGRKDTWICVAQSLRCLLETTTALLIVYNPKQNKKLTVWGEKVKESSR